MATTAKKIRGWKSKKRHSVNKDRSFQKRKNAQLQKHQRALWAERQKREHAAAAAYWQAPLYR